jgi:hypothetical protein
MKRPISFVIGALLIAGGIAILMAGKRSTEVSGPYAAEAVLQVSRPLDGPSLSETLRAECSLLESSALRDGVISNLSLTSNWTGPQGELSRSEIRDRLESSIQVTPNESSEQIRVRVSGSDKAATEELATSVLRVYQDIRRSRLRQSKPKRIITLEEQLEELEPKLQLAQDTVEKLGSDVKLEDVYVPTRNDPTLLDRLREGKEEEPPDTTSSSLYYSEPAPRNETPEQAKRRIYLRSRRLADVLTTRKERIEANLEYERSRTSTAESARVQVVQQPEAVLGGLPAHATTEKRSSFPGWLAIGAGGLSIVHSFTRRKSATPASI